MALPLWHTKLKTPGKRTRQKKMIYSEQSECFFLYGSPYCTNLHRFRLFYYFSCEFFFVCAFVKVLYRYKSNGQRRERMSDGFMYDFSFNFQKFGALFGRLSWPMLRWTSPLLTVIIYFRVTLTQTQFVLCNFFLNAFCCCCFFP